MAHGHVDTRKYSVWHAITYVPVSRERAEERGFNQAERLAATVSSHTQIPLLHLLERKRHSAKQSFKTRSARMQDMESLFAAKRGAVEQFLLANQRKERQYVLRLLLVDDIYTTGSTIQACSEALQIACPDGIDIYALTWARS
ncbi:ComF family protein [Paenibacillus sp. BIHB 4019]|uniref:ComF family protein n=1 Tax=Paenibacillus sp. BIHB 4019 TaxID=1870819 RepID=UPI0012378062|nr:ComF family protein [Paenibacillus sp. BIHB 4019]